MFYGIGYTGLPNPSGANLELLEDGTALLYTGCADIGQGSDTVLAQIVSEELGLNFNKVLVVSADTGRTPNSGPTSASRQTFISGNAALNAAKSIRAILNEKASALLEVNVGDLIFKEEKIYVKIDPDKHISLLEVIKACNQDGILTFSTGWFNPDTTSIDIETGEGKPYATYAYATQYAEVEVDTDTGEVKVNKLIAAHDVGKAINVQLVESQVEGGCIMGLGYALMEELILEKGIIANPNFKNYIIPTAHDIPSIISVNIVEDLEKSGPFGAKGVGEPALIPTTPAVINAISNALGIRFYDCPVTPEKIINALHNCLD